MRGPQALGAHLAVARGTRVSGHTPGAGWGQTHARHTPRLVATPPAPGAPPLGHTPPGRTSLMSFTLLALHTGLGFSKSV